MTFQNPLVFLHFILVVVLHHDAAQLFPFRLSIKHLTIHQEIVHLNTHLFLVGIYNSRRLNQHIGHINQLIPHLLTGHHLQSGTFGLVFALTLTKVNAEMDALLPMINANLDIYVYGGWNALQTVSAKKLPAYRYALHNPQAIFPCGKPWKT